MGRAPPPIPGRLSLDGEPPFVGRLAELEVLEQAWEAVQAGKRQAVFVGGEPGAGKTRLVAEVAAALNQQGTTVLLGTSFVDYGVPYQPFVECLDHLLQEPPSPEVARLIPDSARHLVRLCPRIAAYRTDIDRAGAGAKDDRFDLFAAFRDLLNSLSADQPLVLILEDLQWALEPTRQLLAYLIQVIDDGALLVLATYRTTAPDRSDDLTRVTADLYRLPGVHRIDLAGLDVSDITRYVMAWRGGEVGEARRSAVILRDQTGGNPFFIRELLTQVEGGVEERHLSPPATILDALGARLDSLSDAARSVVELAAIAGDDFDNDTLVAATGEPEPVLDGLDDATEIGLLVRDSSSRFRFRHSLTRQAVVDRMSSSRRADVHAAIARAVESTWPDNGKRHAVLAHHFQEARILGFGSRAAEEAVHAAEHARSTLAYEEAATWYRLAADLGDPARYDERLLLAAHNLVLAGDFESALRLCASLTLSSDPRRAAEAAIVFEDASWRAGLNGSPAVTVLDKALEGIEQDPNDPLYVLLLSRKGRALFYAGSADAASVSSQAISLAGEIGDSYLIGTTLGASVNQLLVPGEMDELIRRSVQYQEWATQARSYDEMAHAAGLIVNLTYMAGDQEARSDAWVTFTEVIEAGDLSYWRFLRENIRSADLFMRGELDAAKQVVRDCQSAGRLFGHDFTDGPFGLQMFMIERELGRLEAVRPIVEAVAHPETHWTPGLLALYSELGLTNEADRLLEAVIDDEVERRRGSVDWPAILALVAEAVIAVGHRKYAEIWRPALAEYSGLNLFAGSFVAVFGSADRYLAQVDAILGLDSAEDHFRLALEMDHRMGSILHEVETLVAYAAYLDRSTDHQRVAKATRLRHRARSIAERKGLVRQLRRLDQSTTVRSDRPAGLTPREVEVLRLIAEGLSNKEIAERLFISQNTAANHIRRILTKTEAGNRTKAAIFAAENGLLS
jgi:DNA-binding CsgD family transcriptional regulator/tetratricopeptide (TPR) repeat protein